MALFVANYIRGYVTYKQNSVIVLPIVLIYSLIPVCGLTRFVSVIVYGTAHLLKQNAVKHQVGFHWLSTNYSNYPGYEEIIPIFVKIVENDFVLTYTDVW